LYLFSFGSEELEDPVTVDTPAGELLLLGQEPLGRRQYQIHPSDEDWRAEEILGDIAQDANERPNEFTGSGENIKIGSITGSEKLNFETLRFYSALGEHPFKFYTSTSYYEQEDFYNEFPEFAYLIILNKTLDDNSEWTKDFIDVNGTGYKSRDFLLLEDYTLPDESVIEVYKRGRASQDYSPPEELISLL